MALSLTTEITTETAKVQCKPIILIEFTDSSFYVASQDYTLTMPGDIQRAFDGILDKGSFPVISEKVTYQFNRVASRGSISFTLNDFTASVQADLLGTTPDLTGENVDVYLKMNTSSVDYTDRSLIFTGTVDSYTVDRNKISFRVKGTDLPGLGLISLETLSEAYNAGSDVLHVPILYGNFSWDNDHRFFGDDGYNGYAPIPYISPSDQGGSYVHKHALASHEMNAIPNSTQANTTDDPYIWLRRDNRWQGIQTSLVTTSNPTSGNGTIDIGTTAVWDYLFPTVSTDAFQYSSTAENSFQAIDGDSSTYATVSNPEFPTLNMHNFKAVYRDSTPVAFWYVALYVDVISSLGSNVATVSLKKKSDDSVVSSAGIPNTDSGWNDYLTIAIGTVAPEDIDQYYVEVRCTVSGNEVHIYGCYLRVQTQTYDPTEDGNYLYLRCKGREFSGTWGSRKTTGNLITKPTDALESILRDELGVTDIETDSFDDVTGQMTSELVAKAVTEPVTAEDLFAEYCEAFGHALRVSPDGKVAVIKPDPSIGFTGSGTTTPGNSDIITYQETLSGGSYTEHPFLKDSARYSRTGSRDMVNLLTMEYRWTVGEGEIASASTGTGSEEVVQNPWIGEAATAASVISDIAGYLDTQRSIVRVTGFLDLVGVEVGDIYNFRDGFLDDDQLQNTVNTQAWMVFDKRVDPLRGLVTLQLVELRN